MSGADDSLLKFPCDCRSRCSAATTPRSALRSLAIVEKHYGKAYSLTEQLSKQAAYLSLTITVRAESRAQVDAVYQDFVASEQILMVF